MKPYKSDDISCKTTFGIKKKQPIKRRLIPGSKFMKRSAKQDLITEYSQGLAY